MTQTQRLMQLAKAKAGLTSDYKLAQALDTSAQRVSNWSTGKDECDDEAGMKLAELAGLPSEYALSLLAAGRSKSVRARAVFLKMAERLAA